MRDSSTFKMSFNESMCSKDIRGKGRILSDTTAGWNSKVSLISEKNVIYVYTDHVKQVDEYGKEYFVPGLKIGDGKAYLIDLPFTDDYMIEHINNNTIHITLAEREFWNDKISIYLDPEDKENIIFTTN